MQNIEYRTTHRLYSVAIAVYEKCNALQHQVRQLLDAHSQIRNNLTYQNIYSSVQWHQDHLSPEIQQRLSCQCCQVS